MFDKDVRKTRSQINDRKYLVKFTPRAGFAFVFASILNFIQFCPLRGAALCECQTRHHQRREEVNHFFFSVANANDFTIIAKILLIWYNKALEFHYESSWKLNFLISCRNKSQCQFGQLSISFMENFSQRLSETFLLYFDLQFL